MLEADYKFGAKLVAKARRFFSNEDYYNTIETLDDYLEEYLAQIKAELKQKRLIIKKLLKADYKFKQESNLDCLNNSEENEVFAEYLQEKINNYFLTLKKHLKQKRYVLYMLLVSYHHLLKQREFNREKIKDFEKYRELYLEVAEWFKKEKKLKEWQQEKLENLIRYDIEIILQKTTELKKETAVLEDEFKAELNQFFRQFLNIFSPPFAEEIFIKQLLAKIHEERNNFERHGLNNYQQIKNTKWMIEIFLKITDGKSNYQKIRANVMNLMADLIYFYGKQEKKRGAKERKTIAWLEKSLAEDRSNKFTKKRIKELKRNMTTTEQINKFRHDMGHKLPDLRGRLAKVKEKIFAISNEEELISELSGLENRLKKAEGLFRLTDKQGPKFKSYTPKEIKRILAGVISNFKELNASSLTFIGETKTVELDEEYFILIVQNLIENSLEAYQRREIAIKDNPITIEFDFSKLEFRVKDQAGGIAQHLQENNKFFEVYVSSKGTQQESGLGMKQVLTAVKLLEADLSYTSNRQGTEFVINFDTLSNY